MEARTQHLFHLDASDGGDESEERGDDGGASEEHGALVRMDNIPVAHCWVRSSGVEVQDSDVARGQDNDVRSAAKEPDQQDDVVADADDGAVAEIGLLMPPVETRMQQRWSVQALVRRRVH